ncbi:hypothetical protein HanPI659440_Chr09g0352541 [Helianthus annuus]|nr:hypothetical protein HanPI659440_Chr09g0352541 [Helianthus annuus]
MRRLWSISTSERKLHEVRVLTSFETSILWSLYLYFNTVYSGDKHTGPELVEAMVLIHELKSLLAYALHMKSLLACCFFSPQPPDITPATFQSKFSTTSCPVPATGFSLLFLFSTTTRKAYKGKL